MPYSLPYTGRPRVTQAWIGVAGGSIHRLRYLRRWKQTMFPSLLLLLCEFIRKIKDVMLESWIIWDKILNLSVIKTVLLEMPRWKAEPSCSFCSLNPDIGISIPKYHPPRCWTSLRVLQHHLARSDNETRHTEAAMVVVVVLNIHRKQLLWTKDPVNLPVARPSLSPTYEIGVECFQDAFLLWLGLLGP